MTTNRRGTEAAPAEVAESVAEAPKPKQWVRYRVQHDFQERFISEMDWRGLGAEGDDVRDVTWSKRNHWRVPREAIKLSDDQLADYLSRDDGLELYEGN